MIMLSFRSDFHRLRIGLLIVSPQRVLDARARALPVPRSLAPDANDDDDGVLSRIGSQVLLMCCCAACTRLSRQSISHSRRVHARTHARVSPARIR